VFSGIVEACASLILAERTPQLVKITVEKPAGWDDLKNGDSVAVNGICLTVERFDLETMQFSLAPETLKVTGWSPNKAEKVNLERSLRMGDRIHGHIVSGHVDGVGRIEAVEDGEGTRLMTVAMSPDFRRYVWRKGSVAINGVSLTINGEDGSTFEVCLIPETLKRTNLGELKIGSQVNLEADAMARAWYHWKGDQQT
jgi:riboflavin synthase